MAKIDRQAHAQMLADHDAQFAGVVAIVLTFAFYAIFCGNLLSPLN